MSYIPLGQLLSRLAAIGGHASASASASARSTAAQMAKTSGEKSARCSSGSLMRLEAVRDVVLARVPLADHRALGQTCKALRRLVNSDDFAKLRKTQGYEECGLLLLGGSVLMEGQWKNFACLTHNLEPLGFTALVECPLDLCEFRTALSADGRLIVCGDVDYDRTVLIYDTREHVWVRDSRYPASLPAAMHSQCTAFLDNTLVIVGGESRLAGGGSGVPLAYAWSEQLRIWEQLPSLPTAVVSPGYGVIGSRLFVVGGVCTDDEAHAEHYGGGRMSHYTARLQIFDITTRTWSLGAPLDALRDRLEEPQSAAVFHGRLYVFCRRVLGSGSDAVIRACPIHAYCFDPRSNSWSELPALPVGSGTLLAACVHDGRLVVVGTLNDYFRAHEADHPAAFHYEWDDRAETWKKQPLLLDDVEEGPFAKLWLGSLVSVPLRLRIR